METREKVVVGNWKMYKTMDETVSFIQELLLRGMSPRPVYIAVPFTALSCAAAAAKGSSLKIGAQNMHDASEGAFTGEISGKMLLDAGAAFVILGHSERRHLFGESNTFINKKVKAALAVGLEPIVCVGETLEEREALQTEKVLQRQLKESLEGVDIQKVLLAYEPVWAIGTGLTATVEQADEAHAFCRQVVGPARILYGGSVKPENSKALLEQKNIDGVLVGGASLTVSSFTKIINV